MQFAVTVNSLKKPLGSDLVHSLFVDALILPIQWALSHIQTWADREVVRLTVVERSHVMLELPGSSRGLVDGWSGRMDAGSSAYA